jgi:sulfofructose kinase
MARVLCVGLACLDYLFSVPTLPAGSGKSFASNYRAAPGGPAATAAIAVAALGHEACFIGRLGDDQVGKDIVSQLAGRGVDVGHIRAIPGQFSQVSAVTIDGSGERQIVNYSSSALDPDPAWIPEEAIGRADFIVADVRWPEGAEFVMKRAQKQSIPSLLDADIAPIDTGYLVDIATYTIFSARGLEMVSHEKDTAKALAAIGSRNRTWPAVTAGEQGSYWLEAGALKSCPAERIVAVDTCGAGDVFHGAFAVAMVENMSIDRAMHFASIAAALKCMSFGGSLGVPERSAVERYLANS